MNRRSKFEIGVHGPERGLAGVRKRAQPGVVASGRSTADTYEVAYFAGTKRERECAREYLDWVLQQRIGAVRSTSLILPVFLSSEKMF